LDRGGVRVITGVSNTMAKVESQV
jgi:hypothetical protein